MNILYGQKVILFPLRPEDLPHFIELHRKDKSGYMLSLCLKDVSEEKARNYILDLLQTGQVMVWIGKTKEGKKSRTVGYIYLCGFDGYFTNLSGVVDKQFLKGLGKELKKKYTYTEDSINTLIDHCFNGAKFKRIETSVIENNRVAIKLCEKIGFKREGILRKKIKLGEVYKDLVLFSILKEER